MNRNLLNNVLIFAAGVGIGSVVTWKIVKTKYDQIIQEEIDSVKEAFSGKKEEKETEKSEEESDEEEIVGAMTDEDKETYQNIIVHASYANCTEKVKEDRAMNEPYVISPEEFGDSDYAVLTMTYFLDGTVLNDHVKIVKNATDLLGENFEKHFGDYPEDPDTVYVRNDALQIDFEVLKDYRYYYAENDE